MRSTGEVMGIDTTFGRAFFKAETAAGTDLPRGGMVFLSLADRDKPAGLVVAQAAAGARPRDRRHPGDGRRSWRASACPSTGWSTRCPTAPAVTAVDLMAGGEITFVINTPAGQRAAGRRPLHPPGRHHHRVSAVTTVEAALAAAQGLSRAGARTTSRSAPSRSTTPGEAAAGGRSPDRLGVRRPPT